MTKCSRSFGHIVLAVVCAGCTTAATAPDPATLYGAACEQKGYARETAEWRGCVESEALNAALRTQKEYDDRLMRQRDCIGPLMPCPPGAR